MKLRHKSSTASGCWVCGTGTGGTMCPTHQRKVRDAAQREGRPPRQRDNFGRGGRR